MVKPDRRLSGMDWDKVKKIAALSNIAAFVLYVIWFAYTIWTAPSSAQPGQSLPVSSGGGTMRNLTISIVAGGFLLLTAGFHLAAVFMSRHKLKGRITELTEANESLSSDLSTANSAFGEYEVKATALEAELAQAKREAKETEKRANEAANNKDSMYKSFQEAERKVADLAWLRDMAEEQATNISKHVILTARKPGSLILSKGRHALCVTVALRIRNESVFDITIHPKDITGRFSFNGTFLQESAQQLIDEDRSAIENLKPMKAETLVLKQPLLQSEAEFISGLQEDEKARFWLGNLSIPISVATNVIQVKPEDLRINSKLEYVYLKEFFGTTTKAEEQEQALSIQELRQKIAALPPDERAQATKAALDLYGKAFYGKDAPDAPK